MELFSYEASELNGCKEIARLGENAVYVGESGFAYLLKHTGSVYQLNDVEAADPQKFLADVEKYNL